MSNSKCFIDNHRNRVISSFYHNDNTKINAFEKRVAEGIAVQRRVPEFPTNWSSGFQEEFINQVLPYIEEGIAEAENARDEKGNLITDDEYIKWRIGTIKVEPADCATFEERAGNRILKDGTPSKSWAEAVKNLDYEYVRNTYGNSSARTHKRKLIEFADETGWVEIRKWLDDNGVEKLDEFTQAAYDAIDAKKGDIDLVSAAKELGTAKKGRGSAEDKAYDPSKEYPFWKGYFKKNGSVKFKDLAETVWDAAHPNIDPQNNEAVDYLIEIISSRKKAEKPASLEQRIENTYDRMKSFIQEYSAGMNFPENTDNLDHVSRMFYKRLEDKITLADLERNSDILPPEDFYVDWFDMDTSPENGQSTTVAKFRDEGIAGMLGIGETEKVSGDMIEANKIMKDKYKEELFRNAVERDFNRKCAESGLSLIETDSLAANIAYRLVAKAKEWIDYPDILVAYHLNKQNVVPTSTLMRVDETRKLPYEKRIAGVISALGTDFVINELKTSLVNDPNMTDMQREAMQLFEDAEYGDDYMRIMLMKANPWIRKLIGMSFNTRIKYRKPSEDSVEGFIEKNDIKENPEGNAGTLEEVVDIHEDEEDTDRIEDMQRNDLIKEDSLTKSLSENLTKTVKYRLGLIQKPGETDVFGSRQYYDYSEIARPLSSVIAKAENSDEMMNLILKSDLPFKEDLLYELEEDGYFKSELFSNFKKAELAYSAVKVWEDIGEDGIGILKSSYKTINDETRQKIKYGEEAFQNAMYPLVSMAKAKNPKSLFRHENIQTDDKFKELVAVSEKVGILREIRKNAANISGGYAYTDSIADMDEYYDKITDERIFDLYKAIEMLGLSPKISYDAFKDYITEDIQISRNGEFRTVKSYNRYHEFARAASGVANLFNISGSEDYKLKLNDAELTVLANIINGLKKKIGDIVGYGVEYGVRHGGRMFISYVNSNYLYRTMDILSNPAKSKEYIEKEYINTVFFKGLFERDAVLKQILGSAYKPVSWITAIYNGMFSPRIKTLSTYNGKKFQDMNRLEYLIHALKAFTHNEGKNQPMADYILPTMSDKSRTGVITAPKLSFQEVLDGIYHVFLQETDRMRNVYLRAKNGTAGKIANYDTDLKDGKAPVLLRGMKFMFVPFLNEYLKDINSDAKCRESMITGWLHNKIYGTDTYSVKESDFKKSIKTLTKEFLDSEAKKSYNEMAEDGTLYTLRVTLGIGKEDFPALFQNFVWNNYFATSQIYELLTGDPAFYKNNTDVVKRTAEFVSDGLVQDVTAMKRGIPVKTTKDCVILKDTNRKFRGYEGLVKIFENRADSDRKAVEETYRKEMEFAKGIVSMQRTAKAKRDDSLARIERNLERRKSHYTKFDATDGQGFISFRYYDNMMHALGRGREIDDIYDTYNGLYKDFADLFTDYLGKEEFMDKFIDLKKRINKFNSENRFGFEVVKQFTYTQLVTEDGIKRPFQIKNAELPLLDIESMMDDAVNENGETGDPSLAILAAWMYKNDIDAVLFESNVKVGASNVYDADFGNLKNSLDIVSGNPGRYVHSIPIQDSMLQQETPSHFENNTMPIGVQYKVTEFGSFTPDSVIIDVATGKEVPASAMMMETDEIHARRIKRHSEKAMEELGANATTDAGRNVKLSRMILDALSKRGELDGDSYFRFSVNDYGQFNIPLSDPVSRKKADSVFTNLIKRSALEVEMPGGQLVQVTDAFRYDKDKVGVERDKSLKIVYYDKNGNETYDSDKADRIAYFEAELPYFYKEMYHLDEISDDRMKRLVMYRIPTEGACSAYPVKVKKWSRKINGGIVKLPAEIPAIGGMDFDIDKLFFLAPSIDFAREKKHSADKTARAFNIKSAHYIDREYAEQNPGNEDAADCNRLLEIMWSSLTSHDNMTAMLIPSNFFDLIHNKNVFAALATHENLTDEQRIKLYNEYQAKSDSELEDIIGRHENPLCSIRYQSESALVNAMAKKLIARFANSNSQHIYMQGTGMKIRNFNVESACSINGNYVLPEQDFDAIFANDGFTKIYENITQFLTASADAVKNPTLYQLNVNLFTANLCIALLRSGFDIETISLIMQQPVVKYMSDLYDQECSKNLDNEYIDINKILNKVIIEDGKRRNRSTAFLWKSKTEMTEGKKHFLSINHTHVSKDDLVRHIGKKINSMEDNTALVSDQMELFKLLYGFLSAHRSILNSNKVLKIDAASSRHGSDIFECFEAIDDIRKQYNEDVITGFPDITEENKNHRRLSESFRQQNRLMAFVTSLFDPNWLSFMRDVNDDFLMMKRKPRANDVTEPRYRTDRIYDDFLLYCMENDLDGTNRYTFGRKNEIPKGWIVSDNSVIDWFINSFPYEATEKLEELSGTESPYKTNPFISKLDFDFNEGVMMLVIPDRSVPTSDMAIVGQGFSRLLHDENPEIRNFALQLFLYNFYRNGLSTRNGSFWHYLPARDIASMINYISFLRNINNGGSLLNDFKAFSELFMLNNPDLINVSENLLAKKDVNTFTAVNHRGRIDWGTELAFDGGMYYAARFDVNALKEVAPVPEITAEGKGIPYIKKNYNNNNVMTSDEYLGLFRTARNAFEFELDALGYTIPAEESPTGRKIYNTHLLSDSEVMEIASKSELGYMKKFDPMFGKNIDNTRKILDDMVKYC